MPNLTLRLGRLYHTETHSSKHTCSEVRDDVLFAAHTAPTGGHSVVRGTLLKLDGIAWWPEIVQDVKTDGASVSCANATSILAHLDVTEHS